MTEATQIPALALKGPVTLASLDAVQATLDRGDPGAPVDLSGVSALDTAGAWLLSRRPGLTVVGADEAKLLLLKTVQAAMPAETIPVRRKAMLRVGDVLEGIGAAWGKVFLAIGQSLGFLGLVMARLAGTLIRPQRLRLTATVHHMQETGLNAVPIVSLMGFLIGVVLAFQGATQLRQFGAEVFVVDLIAFSILRELGILLTAIIVAGRSASAYTAAIGSMKMREEIDAMRVLGLDPIELLVLPRFLALVIVLPILGSIANLAGLFGGGLMAWIELDISPGQFLTQLRANVGYEQALIGMAKAPVFAAIIALVGCQQGMLVKGDAESLGMRTSRAVVI
ncbi:MAG: MlaE family ABC transporter permease, partial [Pararhodobacter sp.]